MALGVPHEEEQINDPRARAEGYRAAIKLDESHLVELTKYQKKAAEDNTRNMRRAWSYYWDLWENRVDFSDKEDWQAQIWVPKVFSAVEQGTALIQRSLLDSPDSFNMSGSDDRDRQLAGIWRPLIRTAAERVKYAYKYSDAVKIGFITGLAGYLKFRWASSLVPMIAGMHPGPDGQLQPAFSNREYSFLALDLVMPWNIRRDPESKPRENFSGRYLWHSEWKSRADIRNMRDAGWDPKAVDELLASKAAGDFSKFATEIQMEERERFYETGVASKFRSPYLVDEGWLDVLDENGDVVYPNALMIHSHEKILFGPNPNPLWATDLATGRRKWPFLAASPIVHPFRFEGRGIVEQDAPLATLYSNVFMLWADSLNWTVNKPTEINQDALVDWEDLEHVPGKLWVKHGSERALIPAEVGGVNTNEVLAAMEYLDRTRQGVNFVNDMITGLPGSRAEITKGEVQIKTAQSIAIFEAMGKNLEQLGSESMEMIYDFLLQFIDASSNPSLETMIGPERAIAILSMRPEEKLQALQGQFDFAFTGVSQALQKADQLQKVMQFSTLAASPAYAGATNPAQVLTVIADLLGISDRLDIKPPMPQMPGMMPGAPGAPGAAAPPTQGGGVPNPTPSAQMAQQEQANGG